LIAIKAAITATRDHYIGLKAMTPNYRQRMTATLRRKEFVQLVLRQKWLFAFRQLRRWWTSYTQQIRPWNKTNLAGWCKLQRIGDWYWQLSTRRLGLTQLWSSRRRVYTLSGWNR